MRIRSRTEESGELSWLVGKYMELVVIERRGLGGEGRRVENGEDTLGSLQHKEANL